MGTNGCCCNSIHVCAYYICQSVFILISKSSVFGYDIMEQLICSEVGELYSRKLASFLEKRLKSERTATVSVSFAFQCGETTNLFIHVQQSIQIWTSTLQRTILTAHPIIGFPKVCCHM
jgi:hypothetical protein